MSVSATPREPTLPRGDIRLKYEYGQPEGTLWARNRPNDSAGAKVRLAHVDQGFLADCFLEATVGALALQRPEVLERMVVSKSDGIHVKLASGLEVISPNLPMKDGALVYGASGGNKVLWPAYIEKAVASQIRGGYRKLNDGGTVQQALAWITGETPKEVATPTGRIIDDLQQQLRAGHAVTISTGDARKGTALYRAMRHANVEPDHVYVVTGTAHGENGPGSEKLRVWNIWGFEQPHPMSEAQVRHLFAEVVTDEKSYWTA